MSYAGYFLSVPPNSPSTLFLHVLCPGYLTAGFDPKEAMVGDYKINGPGVYSPSCHPDRMTGAG